MGERKHRAWVRLPVLGIVTALATGCATIPTGSPVVASSPGVDDGASDVRIEVRPPQTGATPTQIVEGFLDAMSSYAPGFPLAEQFLMPDARDGWVRTAIEVYNRRTLDQAEPSAAFPDATVASVRLAGERAARIDADGRFTAVVPGSEPLAYTLRLERDPAGEWRIDNPPDFLLISSFDLSRTYSPLVTYFPDPEGQVLVPDQVWLPAGEPQIATLLAQAVVDGPTDLIGPGGVANAFPAGTLVGRTVLSGGTITVPLSGLAIGDTDDAARRLMVAQLTETMNSSLPNIDRVSLTIDGEAVDVPDDSGELAALSGFADPPAYVLADDNTILAADPTGTSDFGAVPGELGRGELAARSFAVSLDRSQAATVDETGTQVVRTPLTEEGAPERVFQGEDVAAPSFDRYANLWLVDRRRAGPSSDIRMVQPDGSVLAVAAPDLVGARVTDLRIAPDGVRVAVVTEGAGAALRLGQVVRGALPQIDLTVSIPLDGTVTDVAWSGERELLVVVVPPAGLPRPYSVSVDGSVVTEGSVTGTTAVAAYPSQPAFALSDLRTVLRQTSVLQWDQVSTGRAVTYPG